jgi:hypothetical protein
VRPLGLWLAAMDNQSADAFLVALQTGSTHAGPEPIVGWEPLPFPSNPGPRPSPQRPRAIPRTRPISHPQIDRRPHKARCGYRSAFIRRRPSCHLYDGSCQRCAPREVLLLLGSLRRGAVAHDPQSSSGDGEHESGGHVG